MIKTHKNTYAWDHPRLWRDVYIVCKGDGINVILQQISPLWPCGCSCRRPLTLAPVRSAALDRKISRGRRGADDRTFSTRDAWLDICTLLYIFLVNICVCIYIYMCVCVRVGVLHMLCIYIYNIYVYYIKLNTYFFFNSFTFTYIYTYYNCFCGCLFFAPKYSVCVFFFGIVIHGFFLKFTNILVGLCLFGCCSS